MKAAQINEYGAISVIQVNEVDVPQLKEGQVLVKVHAASLNPFDTTIRAGYLQEMIPLQMPVTLGGDIAGEVTQVSEGVAHIAVGDKVYGQSYVMGGNSGAFAEYTAVAARNIAKVPSGLGWEEAAALPLVGVSAVQVLMEHINLQPGQTILIHGGSGGIGSIAIQIAKHIGAHVTTTASGEGIEVAMRLGANKAIDYKNERFEEKGNSFDAVFDTVGGETYERSLKVVKTGGIIVTMAAEVDEAKAKALGIKAVHQNTRVTSEHLNKLSELVEIGVVTPHVYKVYPLDEVQQAFKAREGEKVLGKVVLKIA
jgi:alcohol dehydrogenase